MVAYKIRKIRELKNLSQEYVASKLGIAQNTYSRLESGNQKLDINVLLEISKILEVDVSEIVNFDESQIFNNLNKAGDNAANIIIHNLSQELINKYYESRIKHLEEEILFLRRKV